MEEEGALEQKEYHLEQQGQPVNERDLSVYPGTEAAQVQAPPQEGDDHQLQALICTRSSSLPAPQDSALSSLKLTRQRRKGSNRAEAGNQG